MRSTRILQLVCGTALTFSMAASALAQQQPQERRQPQPAQPSQPGQPARPQPVQPSERQQVTPRQTAQPIDRTSTEAQLLRRLEGTWNVQISINPALFARQVQDDARGGTPSRPWNDSNRDGTGQRPADGNRSTSPDRTQPDQVNPTAQPGDRTNRTPDRSDPAMKDQGTPPASGILPDSASSPAERPAGAPRTDGQPQDRQAPNRPGDNRQPENLKPLDGERVTRLGAPDATDGIPNVQTMNGYAETKLIMGDKILQQTVVVTGGDTMNGTTPRIQPGNRPGSASEPADKPANQPGNRSTSDNASDRANQPANPTGVDRDDATPGQPGNDRAAPGAANRTGLHGKDHDKQGGYTGISFLSFDEGSRTYSIVFMDDMKGEIRYDTGTFDAAANRIVFDGRDPVMGNENPGRPSSAAAPAAPSTGSPRSDTNRTASSHDNVRVVLELLGNDQHRVTMYKVGGMADPAAQPTGQPTGANTDTSINNSNRTPPTSGTRDFEKPANIIYQATFTRTSGTDNERVQEALRDAEGRSRSNPGNTNSPERR